MKITQVYELVNSATQELLGESSILNEDLQNIVDVGKAIENLDDGYDKYVRSLFNHIGKVVFVNRPYSGSVPSVIMDGWEFGSILEKIRAELPDATENESWELQDGASYDPNVFYKPTVSAKFFNKRVTFEIPVSITERQVKQSFSNPTQLNAFVSMIYNEVDKSMTIKMDSLVMRTINNFIALTINNEYADNTDLDGATGVRAVNLLYMYKQVNSDASSLTAEGAMTDPGFLKFAGYTIGKYLDRIKKASTLFNIGGTTKFTPEDMSHLVLLSDFEKATATYLEADTFHDIFVKLPNHETVTYWQGSGTTYAFSDITNIDVIDSNGVDTDVTGIIGVLFDRDALGVTNLDRRVTTNYNPKAEFYNNWYKFEAGYFNDTDENFIVFFVA